MKQVVADSPQPTNLPGALVEHLTVREIREKNILKLNISWTPPTRETLKEGFIMPTSYDIIVNLQNSTGPCTKDTTLSDRQIVQSNASNIIVPPHHTGTNWLRIKPECTYTISVESQPYHYGEKVELTYKVPKCLDVCRCRPPPPAVLELRAPRLPTGGRNVTWRLAPPGPSATRQRFTIRLTLSELQFMSNANSGVYKRKQQREVAPEYDTRGMPAPAGELRLETRELAPETQYQLLAVAVDELGCTGRSVNVTFTHPGVSQENEESESVALRVVAVAVVAGAVLVVAAAVQWYRGRWPWKLRDGRPRRGRHRRSGVYKFNADSHSILSFPIHQERNVIYVEQEIEDAKARGDADKFEISYNRLQLGRQVGKGAFGRVFIAKAECIGGMPGFHTVAVKKLKHRANSDEVEEFLSEIAMMKKVGRHPNIVTMLGCCTLSEPYCMLMEYVPCGDLLQYLRRLRVEYERVVGGTRRRTGSAGAAAAAAGVAAAAGAAGPRYIDILLATDSEESYVQPESQYSGSGQQSIPETEWSLLSSEGVPQTPTEEKSHKLECVLDPKELQNFAVQIARGMSHLEEKQITHRDLAARNVLIDENKTLKISDFGLSRTGIYVNTKRKKVPLRWLSIEAMRDNLYSSKSDVWAFAIVLWEIGTLGGFPYPTVADMNLLSYLMEGKRLEKPDNCSEDLYSLMLRCWSFSPDARPSFSDLVQYLDSVICRKRVYVDFTNLSPNYTFPPTEKLTHEDSKKIDE